MIIRPCANHKCDSEGDWHMRLTHECRTHHVCEELFQCEKCTGDVIAFLSKPENSSLLWSAHRVNPDCGMPGSEWRPDGCAVPDDFLSGRLVSVVRPLAWI